MRVLQLIDSLAAGGAERIAVNYANGLSEQISFSALVATREEGLLKEQLSKKVCYLFLNRKSTFDYRAILRLRKFIKKNKIAIVHAHGTSFFIAFLLKITYPTVRIYWHEHFGARVKETLWQNMELFFCSRFFAVVFVVNPQLKGWVKEKLFFKNVFFIPNFAVMDEIHIDKTILEGDYGKRIICLANLKKPKNHLAILIAFNELQLRENGWSLHFVGKIYNDSYSEVITTYISQNNLSESVFLLDVRNDIATILFQATIGILASTEEGFPVSLLEYGLAELVVLSTNVGFCAELIQENYNGFLFDPFIPMDLQKQLERIINKSDVECKQFGLNLRKRITECYSKETVMELLLLKYGIK